MSRKLSPAWVLAAAVGACSGCGGLLDSVHGFDFSVGWNTERGRIQVHLLNGEDGPCLDDVRVTIAGRPALRPPRTRGCAPLRFTANLDDRAFVDAALDGIEVVARQGDEEILATLHEAVSLRHENNIVYSDINRGDEGRVVAPKTDTGDFWVQAGSSQTGVHFDVGMRPNTAGGFLFTDVTGRRERLDNRVFTHGVWSQGPEEFDVVQRVTFPATYVTLTGTLSFRLQTLPEFRSADCDAELECFPSGQWTEFTYPVSVYTGYW